MTESESHGRPAGEFSAWLRQMRAALAGEGDADTPCGDCFACCATSHFVHIGPDERECLDGVPAALRFPAPGLPFGHVVLPYDAAGRCPLLDAAGRCSIYDRRPRTCRVYDCRVFAAAGMPADCVPITRQSALWEFTYADDRGRTEHDAVLAAVRFVRDHAACFPGGAVPEDPSQLAVLAVKAAGVFVAGGGGPGAPGSDAACAEVAAAVVAAAGQHRYGSGGATGP